MANEKAERSRMTFGYSLSGLRSNPGEVFSNLFRSRLAFISIIALLSTIFLMVSVLSGITILIWVFLIATFMSTFWIFLFINIVQKENLVELEETVKSLNSLSTHYTPKALLIDEFNSLYLELKSVSNRLLKFNSKLTEFQSGRNEIGIEIKAQAGKLVDYAVNLSSINDLISESTEHLDVNLAKAADGISNMTSTLDRNTSSLAELGKSLITLSKHAALLSLNSEIEATKAGEYGLGFEVIAHTLKSLSDQLDSYGKRISDLGNQISVDATTEIERIISSVDEIAKILSSVETEFGKTERLLHRANESINKIVELERDAKDLELPRYDQ